MLHLGYKLSSEEFGPRDLVRQAVQAEAAGFDFALISDHFHPWTDRQGQSPFVWAVLGAIAGATERLKVGTGVTCPTIRTHPAIVAHAAASVAAMMPGRFFLGVGTGENLNEHVTGAKWPPVDVRREMLEEAVKVIRLLWQGGVRSHRGPHYTLEEARLYTLPPRPPPIMVAASGPKAARLAGRIGDGFVTPDPDRALLRTFRRAGGRGKPSFVEVTVCWARSERQARRTAHELWALAALEGSLFTGDRPARALRGRVQAHHGSPSGRGRGVRPRPGSPPRRDPRGEPSRIRPRLRAPGRSRPGRLPPLLRGRGPAPAPTVPGPAAAARPSTGCVRAMARQVARPRDMTPPLADPGPGGTPPTLAELRGSAAVCRACELWERATQTVFGEGPARAEVMLVGEQPGHEEDLDGRPFVGPAGRLLDEALAAAGLDRARVYVTNVVKHFNWEPRGKWRIHKKPTAWHVRACRPWLMSELAAVRPRIVVCLGATAAQTLLGRGVRVTQSRGQAIPSELAQEVFATLHPSAVLRAPDDDSRRAAMAHLVEDLSTVARRLAEP